MGILEKISYWAWQTLTQYDFIKDPIYFRITLLSVYITNIDLVLSSNET